VARRFEVHRTTITTLLERYHIRPGRLSESVLGQTPRFAGGAVDLTGHRVVRIRPVPHNLPFERATQADNAPSSPATKTPCAGSTHRERKHALKPYLKPVPPTCRNDLHGLGATYPGAKPHIHATQLASGKLTSADTLTI
jgi:hypothetical protein